MMLSHTKDQDGDCKVLDQALLDTVNGSPERMRAFNAQLRQAIDTIYTSKNTQIERSSGIDWMRRCQSNPFAFAFLQKVVEKPMEMFLEHNEYNKHVSDVACSCLFETFIPYGYRDEFLLATVGRWGPRERSWTRFAAFAEVATEVQAELVLQFLATDTPLMPSRRYVQYLSRSRPQEEWASARGWSVLDADQHREAALRCLSVMPQVAHQATSKHVSLVSYLDSVLGPQATREIVKEGLHEYNKHSKKPVYLENIAASRQSSSPANTPSLHYLIQEALRTGNTVRAEQLLPLFGVQDNFVLDYQTKYYNLLNRTQSPAALRLSRKFKEVLTALGWRIGKAVIREWQGQPHPYVYVQFQGGTITYAQRYGSYFPKEGEEVMFRPSSSKGIARDLYTVGFVQLKK